jgi:hypothetical protein
MEQTREALDDDLRLTARKAGDWLFAARGALPTVVWQPASMLSCLANGPPAFGLDRLK